MTRDICEPITWGWCKRRSEVIVMVGQMHWHRILKSVTMVICSWIDDDWCNSTTMAPWICYLYQFSDTTVFHNKKDTKRIKNLNHSGEKMGTQVSIKVKFGTRKIIVFHEVWNVHHLYLYTHPFRILTIFWLGAGA